MKTNLILDVDPFESVYLTELSNDEILIIDGGDKFMHDLGVAVGNIVNWLKSSQTLGEPTMTGMS